MPYGYHDGYYEGHHQAGYGYSAPSQQPHMIGQTSVTPQEYQHQHHQQQQQYRQQQTVQQHRSLPGQKVDVSHLHISSPQLYYPQIPSPHLQTPRQPALPTPQQQQQQQQQQEYSFYGQYSGQYGQAGQQQHQQQQQYYSQPALQSYSSTTQYQQQPASQPFPFHQAQGSVTPQLSYHTAPSQQQPQRKYEQRPQQQYEQQQQYVQPQPPQQHQQRPYEPREQQQRQPQQYDQQYGQQHQSQYQPPGTIDPRAFYSANSAPKSTSQPLVQAQYEKPVDTQYQSNAHAYMPSSPDPLQASPLPSNPRVKQESFNQPSPQLSSKTHQHYQQAQPSPVEFQRSQEMPSHRTLAKVEIPVTHANAAHHDSINDRPQKRRRSNEGHALPAPARELSYSTGPKKAVDHQSSHRAPPAESLIEQPSSHLAPAQQPDIDYQAVLLSLADEYIAAAYSMSASLATPDAPQALQDEYYSLISTAMGCLESVLGHYRQPDHRTEARLRLRLATLMVEETENSEEAEAVLGKGIALCERSRLPDLKYAMHRLLIRLTYKSSPKAALRAIDKLIPELEALHVHHWLYCFRFLRVSLSLQGSIRAESNAALKHLAAISATADEQRDIAIQIVAAVFEGIVHLRCGAEDAAELAQRAFAMARTHQLSEEMGRMPQISALLDCLDLACCVLQLKLDQIDTRLQQVETNLDALTRLPGWNKDGSIHVGLAMPASEDLEKDSCGVFRRAKDGTVTLPFQWISKSQLYALAYALSGFARLCKNAESTKAEAFFREGLKLCQQPPDTVARSFENANLELARRYSMGIAIQIHLVFALCARFEWPAAQEALHNVEEELSLRGDEIDSDAQRTLLYLNAVCRQGAGDLQQASVLYNSPDLAFDADKVHKMPCHERDLRLLAAMNNVFISRALDVEARAKAEDIVSSIEPHAARHVNPSIKAAFSVIHVTSPNPGNAIMKTKQYLQVAIDAAKAASNNQLLCVVMNIMTATMFANIVGDQAEKSARAGVSLARKARHPLWAVVANGMYGNIMERCGKPAEAQGARKEAQVLYAGFSDSLKQAMQGL